MLEYIAAIDRCIIDFFYGIQNETISRILAPFSFAGSDGLIWMILISIMLMSKKYRKIGCIAACAFFLSRITVDILKPLFKRPRPFQELAYLEIYIPKPTSFSFPSGHALTAFAIVGVLINKINDNFCKIILILLASLISISRLYFLVHHPSDTLVGIILGLIIAQIALCFCDSNDL